MSPMQSRTLLVAPSSDEFDEVDEKELQFQQLKVAIHEKLVDSLDLSMLAHVPQEQLADLKIDGDKASAKAGDRELAFVKEGGRWYLTSEVIGG